MSITFVLPVCPSVCSYVTCIKKNYMDFDEIW
jgi:hypothetical protein